MVQLYEIKGSPDEIAAQHKKCASCKGLNVTCPEVVKCMLPICGKHFHIECVPDGRGPSDDDDFADMVEFYCSDQCSQKHKDSRQKYGTSDPIALAEIERLTRVIESQKATCSKLATEKDKLIAAGTKFEKQTDMLEKEVRRLQADQSARIFSSTVFPTAASTHPSQEPGTSHSASTHQDSEEFTAADAYMRRLLKKADSFSLPLQPDDSPNEVLNLTSLANKTQMNQNDIGTAHATASLMISLSERRKQLPKLPEFDGKGAEWLHFRNSYNDTRKLGEYTDKEMVAKLATALKGPALEFTRLWLYSARPCPDKIIHDLEQRFFSPISVVTDALDVVHDISAISTKDRNALELFKRAVDGFINVCNDVEETMQLQIHIPEAIEDKLPDDLLEKWNRNIRHKLIKGHWLDFSHFLSESTSDLKVRLADRKKSKLKESKTEGKLSKSAVKLNVVSTQQAATSTNNNRSSSRGVGGDKRSKQSNNKPSNGSNGTYQSKFEGDCPPCDYDNCGKVLFRCRNFATRPFDIKMANCNRLGYCSKCLRKGHAAVNCPNVKLIPKCMIPGCTDSLNHTTVMHPPTCDAPLSITNAHLRESNSSLFQIIPVLVDDIDGNQIAVTAFIDSGSNASLITGDLYKRLGIKGESYNLMASWCAAGVKQKSIGSSKLKLTIAPMDNPLEKYVLKNMISMDNLQLPMQEQCEADIHAVFPHLQSIKIPEFDMQRPQVLLGLHHRYLTVPEEVVLPPEDQISAVAEKTKLGWAISCANLPQFNLNAMDISDQSEDLRVINSSMPITLEQLHVLVRHFLDADLTSGIYQDRHYFTSEDRRSMQVLSRTMKQVGDRYEVGLLWKTDNVRLPDNYLTALSRLKSTEQTLRRRNLVDWANDHHKLLVESGFAREATSADLNPAFPHKRVNYVIGFVVINANKTPPKPRWVVDTSCCHYGVSLNSTLLKGPDNLIPLTQALFHFRERRYATVGDVQKQFHQINIIKEDVQCQRFLWRNCDSSQEPKIYIHTAMLFGPTDSPAKANAVRIQHARNCSKTHPLASRAALNSMYQDDEFNSEDTVEEAVETACQSIDMFSSISWKLLDFRSNSNDVLAQLPTGHVNENILIELSKDDPTLYCCKVLGIFWNPVKDILQFKQTAEMELRLKTLNENYHPSKREILSFVMRIFDCLGLIAHFVVRGKVVLQNIWKEQTGWDDGISEDIFKAWKQWIELFDQIARLEIPRHYGYDSDTVKDISLHVFTDASQEAYAAVAFFRFLYIDGNIHVFHIMAKCRVAPKKPLSVPKLELDGAVIGTRIGKIVTDQHKRLTISSIVFWTDSEITLKWIRGVHLKLLPYVAPRACEIRDSFPIACWRHVPTHLNPADDGTKIKSIDFSDDKQRWYTGPEFLKEPSEEWPQERVPYVPPSEEFIMAVNVSTDDKYYAGVFQDIQPSTRANWNRYRKVMAYVLRFKNNLLCKVDSENRNVSDTIEPDELNECENFMLKQIQYENWPEESQLLMRGKTLRKNHSKQLRTLGAFISSDGLIRVRTRMANERYLPFDTRFPIILPSSHETVNVIVKHHHERNHHFGIEATIARLRSKYWIIGVRAVVKRAIFRCLFCLEMKAKAYNIPVGDLPEVRITSTTKAFEHVGADCFGPYQIYSGESKYRREVNVVVFTCLVTRAIYLRRLNRMTSDEMFTAIQELWTRRGPICTIRSDNGTNFAGCGKLINRALREKLSVEFSLKWIFNPVYTPQWGGAWERLIRDIKRALKAAMHGVRLSDRVFDTMLYQVEDIVNTTPMTHIPATPDDNIPVTPNLMVKLHPGYAFVSSQAPPNPENAKWIVQRAQFYAAKFQQRWVKEYLPIIARHSPKGGPKRDIKLGDYVIYCDPHVHPSKWHRGVVHETYSGRDGFARVADVKLKSGEILPKRSAYRLALLDIDNEHFHNQGNAEEINAQISLFLIANFEKFAFSNRHPKFEPPTGSINVLSTFPLANPTTTKDKQNSPRGIEILSNASIFINILLIQDNLAMQYCQLKRTHTFELGKALQKVRWTQATAIHKNSLEENAIKLFSSFNDRNYIDVNNRYTLKLEASGGLPNYFDYLVSFASLKAKVNRLFIEDVSTPAPLVTFAILDSARDVDRLVELGTMQVMDDSLRITRPRVARPMPTSVGQFEHCVVRWWPHDRIEEWKIVLTRVSSERVASAATVPRYAPALSHEWQNRTRNYLNPLTEAYLHWVDPRVENSTYTLAQSRLNAVAIPAATSMEVEIGQIRNSRDVGTQTVCTEDVSSRKRRNVSPAPSSSSSSRKRAANELKPASRLSSVIVRPCDTNEQVLSLDVTADEEEELLRSD